MKIGVAGKNCVLGTILEILRNEVKMVELNQGMREVYKKGSKMVT